jgi:hypothetical protein
MVPVDLKDFLVGCLGASASFIGLLFVGLSVVLQRVAANQKLADTDRILAESSYGSLINIFFIGLVGILPQASLGYVCLTMSLIGLLSCWRLRRFSHPISLVISSVVYLFELAFAVSILIHPHNYLNIGVFETIIIALFSISLFRAWGLTGIREPHTK